MVNVSIIVPVYNVEKYLRKCLDSISSQTLKEIEVILVDDGSTDSSSKICDEYSKIDNRFKVIHKTNGGLSDARNVGIDIARGQYIGFVDSDDYININMFEILYSNIIIYDADISVCDFKKVYEDNNDIIENYNGYIIHKYSNMDSLNQLYNENVFSFVPAWNKLYKKDLFKELRYKVGKIHEDEYIIHELLYSCKNVIYITCDLYYYLQRDGSIMKLKYSISRLDALDAYRERVIFFKRIGEKKLIKNAVFEYSIKFFESYFRVKYEIDNSYKYLIKIKKEYLKLLKDVLFCDLYSMKERITIMIFCISPILYEKYYR